MIPTDMAGFTFSLSALKHSLATRIVLVFVLTSLLMAGVIFIMIMHGFAGQWKSNIRPHLAQYLDYVNTDIGNPPDIERAARLARELPINIYINGPQVQFSSTGKPMDMAELEFDKPEKYDRQRYGNRHRGAHGLQTDNEIDIGEHQERTVLRSKLGDFQVYYELTHRGKRGHRNRIIFNTVLGILGLLGLCYLIFRRMLRPVQDIKSGVKRMGQGDLAYRVPIRATNDLGDVAGSINTMASDIEKMLDAKRQLLLGVSHELRSPLTRANIAVQLLDENQHTRQIFEDLQEMESLITEILETERMNTRHASIIRTPLELGLLARSIIEELATKRIALDIPDGEVYAEVDEPRMRLLLRNILSNAIRHGTDTAKPPTLSLSRQGEEITIKMTDFGPGIGQQHLDRVTEPFYRADPSRTRATGGFGIGLYLCKLIAEAHQGELQIRSESGQGAQITVIVKG